MKKVLITGASGQLGLALNQLFKEKEDYIIYQTDRSEDSEHGIMALDISDEEAVNAMIDQIKPEIIINCAALTAVDLCETEEQMAYRINALGPKYLAVAADKKDAKLIHISTDYVYDGHASKPYQEGDPTNPLSVYGRTKLAGDEFVISHCKKSFVLRTAWVYGEGKNFVKTMLRLADSGKSIRVVADQFGTPTSALELARVILFLMETDSYGIYHATCEGSTSWYEFALEIFRQAGKQVSVEPIASSEYPTPATRPKYSVLDNKALRERHGYTMKQWKEAFVEYCQHTFH
ncbi:MAG: dTDP-4-dehydrorhamnose reductase [Clostridiales bacterium]|jgi:dTDP-4-dehydrorhamnose reductase|nr:dTDP-4-dehydrorhamnose reductase [Clostridiales bacterium]